MENIFAGLVLGHLTGDYLLQNKRMAIAKSSPGWRGRLWCLAHCLLYTATVMVFLGSASPAVALIVFFSHWPLDRWSLAGKWLKFIGARDFMTEFASSGQYRDIHLPFAVLVYAVADNALHLILMWLGLSWLM
ncbi:MAG: DUF3307 domain-containing protein [Patescibacteria group bacterium]|jgi:hypothetical protein